MVRPTAQSPHPRFVMKLHPTLPLYCIIQGWEINFYTGPLGTIIFPQCKNRLDSTSKCFTTQIKKKATQQAYVLIYVLIDLR